MADYFTQFSCVLDVGSADNAAAALAIHAQMAIDLERDDDIAIGFRVAVSSDDPSSLWLTDDDGHGEPEYVVGFVLRCAEAFGLTGRWGFVWALTCTRARLDGFGGGAQVLDLAARKSLDWIDCSHWLSLRLGG
jgi:hypothetical protein